VCQVDAMIKHLCYYRPNVCQVDATIKKINEYIILSINNFVTTLLQYSIYNIIVRTLLESRTCHTASRTYYV